jgi:sugar lactone lactonase YvrE
MSNPETIVEETVRPVPRRRSKRGRQVMAFVLVVLFLLLIGVSFFLVQLVLPSGKVASNPNEAGGLEWTRSIYGWGKAKTQQMVGPGSIAIGPGGTIWTTDAGTKGVIGFNPDGTYNTMLAGTAQAPLISPTDIGTDPAGNVYIAENTTNRVVVMTPQGALLRVIRVQTPTAVTASSDRIVVGSNGGFAILDKEGNPIKIIGTNGSADGQFDRVNGVVIGPDGKIYVVDTYNNRISAYDRLGNRLWIVSTGNPGNKSQISQSTAPKTSNAQANLQLPLQMTMDANGRLVVVDPFDFSLTVLDAKNGQLIAKYGAFGGEDGKMLYPSGVGYDATRDWFVVADTTNNRIQIFRLPGSAPGSVAGTFSRMLAGPTRALLFPLVLLLSAPVVPLVNRWWKRRAARKPPIRTPKAA